MAPPVQRTQLKHSRFTSSCRCFSSFGYKLMTLSLEFQTQLQDCQHNFVKAYKEAKAWKTSP
eukprot:3261870-Amphidinium_carterae.1